MSGRDVCLSHCKPCRIEYGCANFCHICDLPTTPGDLFVELAALRRALEAFRAPLVRVVDCLNAALVKLHRRFHRALAFLAHVPPKVLTPWVGVDPGAPGGDYTAFRRFTTGEIATYFGVPRELLSARAAAVAIMPRRAGKARMAAFYYSAYRRSYAYRVMREIGALGKRVNAPSGKVRPSVTRHMLKLQRYAYRAMSGRG
jgi:hypothetical protein